MAQSASVNVNSNLGTALTELLSAEEIVPGSEPSYQLCKTIYTYHPLGAKMVDGPLTLAQSQPRKVTIQKGPEDRLKEAFLEEWATLGCDGYIFNTMSVTRTYGIGTLALVSEGTPGDRPINFKTLKDTRITFNVLDPLNTAGSLVLNQDPNAFDYQKPGVVTVSGQRYHPSRIVTMQNERPLYIQYTPSAFGFTGRSVYQRALFPLKSFIQSMITDDMVTLKAGILVEKIKQAGSIVDNLMSTFTGFKRQLLKAARTGNVISVSPEEFIESIDLKNLGEPYAMARKNLIENIATAADEPAKLLLQESFAEGFGEGSEDAKYIAKFIDRVRVQMNPLYRFMDRVVQYRAWTPEFYKTLQNDFPGKYDGIGYTQAFYDWTNSFEAAWPSLITEPPSEEAKVDKVKLEAIVALVETLLPQMDPDNRVALITWAADNFNELKMLFGQPLVLDWDALASWEPPQPVAAPGGEGSPPAFSDSNRFARLNAAVADLQRPGRPSPARKVA